MRSQKTELSGRSPLRKLRSALDCSDIEEGEVEEEEEEEEMMIMMMLMMMMMRLPTL
jgi:hypothetical protein